MEEIGEKESNLPQKQETRQIFYQTQKDSNEEEKLDSGVYFIPIKPKQPETNIHDQLKKSISNKTTKLPQNKHDEQEISIPIIKKFIVLKINKPGEDYKIMQ